MPNLTRRTFVQAVAAGATASQVPAATRLNAGVHYHETVRNPSPGQNPFQAGTGKEYTPAGWTGMEVDFTSTTIFVSIRPERIWTNRSNLPASGRARGSAQSNHFIGPFSFCCLSRTRSSTVSRPAKHLPQHV